MPKEQSMLITLAPRTLAWLRRAASIGSASARLGSAAVLATRADRATLWLGV